MVRRSYRQQVMKPFDSGNVLPGPRRQARSTLVTSHQQVRGLVKPEQLLVHQQVGCRQPAVLLDGVRPDASAIKPRGHLLQSWTAHFDRHKKRGSTKKRD